VHSLSVEFHGGGSSTAIFSDLRTSYPEVGKLLTISLVVESNLHGVSPPSITHSVRAELGNWTAVNVMLALNIEVQAIMLRKTLRLYSNTIPSRDILVASPDQVQEVNIFYSILICSDDSAQRVQLVSFVVHEPIPRRYPSLVY